MTATMYVKLVIREQPTGYKQVSISDRVSTCQKLQCIRESIRPVYKIVSRDGRLSVCNNFYCSW